MLQAYFYNIIRSDFISLRGKYKQLPCYCGVRIVQDDLKSRCAVMASQDLKNEEPLRCASAVSKEKVSDSCNLPQSAVGLCAEEVLYSAESSNIADNGEPSILQVQKALIPQLLQRLTVFLWISYAALVFLVFFFLWDRCEYLSYNEQLSAFAITCVFLTTFIDQVFSISITEDLSFREVKKLVLTVTSIAGFTNMMLATIKVPVLRDPVTGCKVLMLRWSEWTVCAFAMTFMVQILDAKSQREALPLALSQGLSASCGLIFPLTSSRVEWVVAMAISFVLFAPIFPATFSKRKGYLALRDLPKSSWADVCNFSQKHAALHIMFTCTIAWSILVINYFIEPIVLWRLGKEAGDSYGFFSQLVIDMAFKKYYAMVIDSCQRSLFDPLKEVDTDLQLTRNQLQMVWENCGDGLVIFSKDRAGQMKARVSPSMRELLSEKKVKQEHSKSFFRQLMSYAWPLVSSDITHLKVDVIDTEDGQKMHTECKVKGDDPRIVTVRDITDRVQRFEAEKALAVSLTARRKDDEANRFCRHEVKNGLFGAQIQLQNIIDIHNAAIKSGSVSVSSEYNMDLSARLNSCVSEIKQTTSAVSLLVTAKDIVNGAYVGHPESVILSKLFKQWCEKDDRLVINPSSCVHSLPELMIDVHVLTIIKNNTVSNALKYGDCSAKVFIDAQMHNNILNFTVENSPGVNHNDLVSMKDPSVVFVKGWRSDSENLHSRISNGDGGWIVQQCAKAMKGECTIEFLPESTIFRLTVPVSITGSFCTSYRFPADMWFLFIDDSRSQRMLFVQLLKNMGMPVERTIIRGKDEAEILGFSTLVMDLIRSKPQKKYIIVFDENLEYTCAETGKTELTSGSFLAQQLRADLKEMEVNTLMLIRSANDGAEDLKVYLTRAHGFLAKSLNKVDFMSNLVPFILDRFSVPSENATEVEADEILQTIVEEIKVDVKLLKEQYSSPPIDPTIAKRILHRLKGNISSMEDKADNLLVASLQEIKKLEGAAFMDALKSIMVTLQTKFHELK